MSHWACQYIGLPWQLGCRDGSAVDCWGLVVWVQQQQFNRQLPDIVVTDDNLKQFIHTFRAHPERQRWQLTETPIEGDAVLLRQSRYPMHVGVWVCISQAEQGVLHCVKGNGVVFQSLSSLRLSSWQVSGYYRYNDDMLLPT